MNKKALIVGVNYYESIAPLYCCANDALAFSAMLEYNADHEKNFHSKVISAKDPNTLITRNRLKQEINTLFCENIDIALFYFSGHGHVENSGGYLVTSECIQGDDGLAMYELMKIVNDSPADTKIVILDCCYSGKLGVDLYDDTISEVGDGVTILSASAPHRRALEKEGRGVFTSLLIDALNGSAADILGKIYLESLYAHITPALSLWEQTPTCKLSISGLTLLREVAPPFPIVELKKIITLFDTAAQIIDLDPSFEPESASARLENTRKFALLQQYNRVNLVIPHEAPHMYHAAMWSKGCKLTRLGSYYWNLVKNKKI